MDIGIPGGDSKTMTSPELIDAEVLIESLPELAISTASACTSATRQPSYVLGALGFDEARIKGSVRLSIGRFTTETQVDTAVRLLVAAATTSPRS